MLVSLLPAEGICSQVLVVPSLLTQFPQTLHKQHRVLPAPHIDVMTPILLIPPLFPSCWHHPQTYRRPIKFVFCNFKCYSVQLYRWKYAWSKAVSVLWCDVSSLLTASYPRTSTSVTYPTVIPSSIALQDAPPACPNSSYSRNTCEQTLHPELSL